LPRRTGAISPALAESGRPRGRCPPRRCRGRPWAAFHFYFYFSAKVRALAPSVRFAAAWRGEGLGRSAIQIIFSKKSTRAREHFSEKFGLHEGRWVYEKKRAKAIWKRVKDLYSRAARRSLLLRAVKRRRSSGCNWPLAVSRFAATC
jgi:hypothetical protein